MRIRFWLAAAAATVAVGASAYAWQRDGANPQRTELNELATNARLPDAGPGEPANAQDSARLPEIGPHNRKDGDTAWLSDEQVLQNLSTVVFGSEFVGEDSQFVRKWIGPMRVAVYGDDKGDYNDLVDAHLGLLRRLTGLEISRVRWDDAGVNASILFLSKPEFRRYAKEYLGKGKPGTNHNLACFGVFRANAARDIIGFSAMIPLSGSREEIDACIVEEVTQVLGLPNDSFDIHPTIFNDDDEYHQLTWQDQLMLEVLYDPRVKPGMTRQEFTPVARTIIEQLRPEAGSAVAAGPASPQAPVGSTSATPASFRVVESPHLTRDMVQH
jgi:hypothetical protein